MNQPDLAILDKQHNLDCFKHLACSCVLCCRKDAYLSSFQKKKKKESKIKLVSK